MKGLYLYPYLYLYLDASLYLYLNRPLKQICLSGNKELPSYQAANPRSFREMIIDILARPHVHA